MPRRFGEWSGATWELQLAFKTKPDEKSQAYDMRFLAVFNDDDAATMQRWGETMSGRVLQQWWDRSDAAGPKSRPHQRFQEEPPALELLTVANGQVKRLSVQLIQRP